MDRPELTDEEIEVTPEMVEAGAEELAYFDSTDDDPAEGWVQAVYEAMERARLRRRAAATQFV